MTQPNEIDKAIDNIADSIHDEIKGDILYRDLKEAVEMGYMLGFQQGCQDAIEKKVLADKLIDLWNRRRFVTGNISSQDKEEEAYKRGWESCFIRIRQELLAEVKDE